MKYRIFKRYRSGKNGGQHYHVNVLANKIVRKLKPFTKKIEIAGSIRRKKPAQDIDIVAIPKDKDQILNQLKHLGTVKANGEKQIFTDIKGVQVDVFFATPEDYYSQLLTRTGPAGSNISHRAAARDKGMILNQYGLFDKKTGRRVARTEHGIYKALGLKYRPPEHRGEPRTMNFAFIDPRDYMEEMKLETEIGLRCKKCKNYANVDEKGLCANCAREIQKEQVQKNG